LAFLCVVVLPPVWGQDDRVPRPIFEVGDRWTFRGVDVVGPGAEDYDLEVVRVGSDVIQVVCTRKRDAREFDATYTLEWGAAVTCSGYVNSPANAFLRFPLKPGDSHSYAYASRNPKDHDQRNEVQAKSVVRGWEQVRVPAGAFRALRIDVEAQVSIPSPTGAQWLRRTSSYWYAPSVRNYVKSTSRIQGQGRNWDTELLSYKLIE
jgi:hypothetical protein